MLSNKLKTILIFFSASILLSGCTINFNTASSNDFGGIFKSANKGALWQRTDLIPTVTGQPANIGGLSASAMVMDPSDNKAIYYGGVENGLFYTYNGAASWGQVLGLGAVTINAVAIDYKYKCTIYAGVANKLYKTIDCGRSWSQVYYDNDPKVLVTAVATDPFDNSIIYIGTSRGEIIMSSDYGSSWRTINRVDNSIKKIIISPSDKRIIFAGTVSDGLYRTLNQGISWVNLTDNSDELKQSRNFRDLIITPNNILFIANGYGLLKSTNNGDSWTKLNLITPQGTTVINAVAVNPDNIDEIYYVTNTTFYHSVDGGKNWSTQKLPTARAGSQLLIDPRNPSTIYMSVK
jgi:photosystem II stability/assembly factor-like uncharacterized protein